MLATDSNFFPARWALGEWYLRQNDYPAAIRELREACRLDPDSVEAQAELAYCLGKSKTGRSLKEAMNTVASLEQPPPGKHIPPTALAVAQLGLGQTNNALASLEQGRDQHDERLVWLEVDPVFGDLGPEPRFQRIKNAVIASP